jgi:hypothetical protein
MIDADPSLRAATLLSTSALAIYLHSTGWTIRPSRVKGVAIYSKTLPGAEEPVHILLPEPGIDDERRRIADALRTIEAVEERPLATIAHEVSQIPSGTNLPVRFNSEAVAQRPSVIDYIGSLTIETYLVWLSRLSTYVGITVLLSLFVVKFQISTAAGDGVFRLENGIAFIREAPFALPLILLDISLYILGSKSAKLELSIGSKSFPLNRTPTVWNDQKDPVIIFLSVVLHLLLYSLLVWFANDIRILSFIMTIVACIDWRTRYLVEKAAATYFSDDNYSPRPGEQQFELIEERRSVFVQYLEHPHLLKEGARIAGCGLAFAISMYGYFSNDNTLNFTAYWILLGVVILNEALTLSWRFKLVHGMKAIDNRAGGGDLQRASG